MRWQSSSCSGQDLNVGGWAGEAVVGDVITSTLLDKEKKKEIGCLLYLYLGQRCDITRTVLP